jgi:hypothetical protein
MLGGVRLHEAEHDDCRRERGEAREEKSEFHFLRNFSTTPNEFGRQVRQVR